jgi:hypothetical protein
MLSVEELRAIARVVRSTGDRRPTDIGEAIDHID